MAGIKFKITKLFILCIAFWLKILALAITSICNICSAVNWGVSRKGGRFKDTPGGEMSLIRKPLSAKIRSPGAYCSKSSFFNVITLPDVEHGNKLLTKVTTP